MPIRFNRLKKIIVEAHKQGISLQKRLFVLFVIYILIIMSFILLILNISGVFNIGIREQKAVLNTEINDLTNNIYTNFGEISIKSVALSQALSIQMDCLLQQYGIEPNDLSNHPELINLLLSEIFPSMKEALEKVESSGVFIILDATINPSLENSRYSRAGLFIKNMEPNIINASSPYTVLLRGPASIARSNILQMHSEWALEYNIKDATYFFLPMLAAKNTNLPLTRLYYWSEAINLPGVSEVGMLCSVPIISSNGTVLGVCGFEVSNMLFKLTNSPNISSYSRTLCLLTPVKNEIFQIQKSLYSYDHSQNTMQQINSLKPELKYHNSFYIYKQNNGEHYAGLHKFLSLYPENSVFHNEKWAVALIMPLEDMTEKLSGNSFLILCLLVILMIGCIISSIYISKQYISPIIEALDMVKSDEFRELPKTKIPEINDLFEYLAKQDENIEAIPPSRSSLVTNFTKYNHFIKNIDSLSKSERCIFDLYIEGYTANEIANKLFLSINTIKTHNKHIYAKLEVSSRKELLVYVQMMKELS